MTKARHWSRRHALSAGLGSIAALAEAPALAAIARGAARQPPLIDDVTHYAKLGPHETGSPGNLRTLDWIEQRLAATGFTVTRQPVSYPSHAIRTAQIEAGTTAIDGIALHPARPTGTTGLRAPLVLAGDNRTATGAITVIRLPYARHSSLLEPRVDVPVKAAIAAGSAGLVLVTNGPSAEALALNAPLKHVVEGLPVLIVAPRDAAPLIAAAARNEGGRLVIDGDPIVATSANIVARRPGRGRTIVVSTPLSGWFACAGERGSGVAAFLRLAKSLADRYPKADLLFVGMVGHEREYVGGQQFLASAAPPPDDVRLWVHIGANFAARDWHEVSDTQLAPLPSADAQRYLLAPAAWLDRIRPTLRGLPGYEVPYPAALENAAGEARQIIRRGHTRILTTFGAHRLHHARSDTAVAVDAGSLEASWTGWSRSVFALLDGPSAP